MDIKALRPRPAPRDDRAPRRRGGETRALRVLIADDVPLQRRSLEQALTLFGFTVDTCPNGRTALSLVARREYGLLILDHFMPHLTGLDVARHLRKKGASVPILIMTGTPDPSIETSCGAVGGLELLLKPFSIHELRLVVSRLTRAD